MKLFTLLATNWYSVFYWLTVSDSVKKFFDVFSTLFSWFTVLSLIVLVICTIGKSAAISENRITSPEEEGKDSDVRSWERVRGYTAKFFYTCLILTVVTWFGYVATPSKKDCLLIVAGGSVGSFMTSDSSAKALPADVTRYLHLSLKNQITNLSDDAKKEIGIDTVPVVKSAKATLLEKAKDLTKEQLIEYLKNDTTLAK